MPRYYNVSVTCVSDPDARASFRIEPPIQYINESSKDELTGVVRSIIVDRMGSGEDNGLELSITHNLPDDSATIGCARFRGLELATGAVVLQQALELALNGTTDHVSPESPLNR